MWRNGSCLWALVLNVLCSLSFRTYYVHSISLNVRIWNRLFFNHENLAQSLTIYFNHWVIVFIIYEPPALAGKLDSFVTLVAVIWHYFEKCGLLSCFGAFLKIKTSRAKRRAQLNKIILKTNVASSRLFTPCNKF